MSAFNLCVSYLNALSNSVRRMVSENLFGDRVRLSFRPFFLLGIVFALTVLSTIASYFSTGFFLMFDCYRRFNLHEMDSPVNLI